MFIMPTKPREDTPSLSSQEDVLTFATAEFAPCLLHLNQLGTALILHQQRLQDMSYHHMMALKGGLLPPAVKQEPVLHGLPLCSDGHYPETPNTGDGVLALVR